MPYRKYTDTDRETAVALIKHEGRSYRVVAQQTGIPATTIQTWCENTRPVHEIPVRERNLVHNELLNRIDEKVDALLVAVNPQRIAEANLVAITNALSTLLDKRQRLIESTAVTPLELEQRQQLVAEIILRHVSDPKEREAIAAEFDRLGQRDNDTDTAQPRTDPALRLMDTDEGK